MAGPQTYANGVLIEQHDDETRTYKRWDLEGTLLEERAYNAQENAEADARAAEQALTDNAETISSRLLTVDLPAMQAILNQTNADLRADPAQEIKDIARAVRRLTRKVESLLDGTD